MWSFASLGGFGIFPHTKNARQLYFCSKLTYPVMGFDSMKMAPLVMKTHPICVVFAPTEAR